MSTADTRSESLEIAHPKKAAFLEALQWLATFNSDRHGSTSKLTLRSLDWCMSVMQHRRYVSAGLALALVLGSGAARPCVAQWDTAWTKTFGGEASDRGYSVLETTDGGFLIAGLTYSFGAGNSDAWIIRTDSAGDVMWERVYGGKGDDRAYWVTEMMDGGYAVAGESSSSSAGSADGWLLRLDEVGDTMWTRTLGGEGRDWLEGVVSTPDGGVIVVGGTASAGPEGTEFWIIRLDSLGHEVWVRAFGGEGDQWAEEVRLTSDGEYLVPGWTIQGQGGQPDGMVVLIDLAGEVRWNRVFGGPLWDGAKSGVEAPDGGYVISGVTTADDGRGRDAWVLRLDNGGDALWTRNFGGAGDDWSFSILARRQGDFVATGRTSSKGAGDADLWVIHLDSEGGLLWDGTFGGPGYDLGTMIAPVTSGGFVLIGFTNSTGSGDHDIWLLRLVERHGG